MITEEKIILAANFYERNREEGAKDMMRYLRENGITYYDAELMQEAMLNNIDIIQEEQDNKYSGSNIEIVFGCSFIKNCRNLVKKDRKIKEIKDDFEMISLVAYKYQMKYTVLVLEEMIQDKEIWDKVILH